MGRMDIMQGDIVRTKKVTSTTPSVIPGTHITEDLEAIDGKVFVMVILGVEPLNKGGELDIADAMNEMGWFRRSQILAETRPDSRDDALKEIRWWCRHDHAADGATAKDALSQIEQIIDKEKT